MILSQQPQYYLMITMYLIDVFGTKLTTASSFHPSVTQDKHPRNKNTQPEAQQEHWSAKLKHNTVVGLRQKITPASFDNHMINTPHVHCIVSLSFKHTHRAVPL